MNELGKNADPGAMEALENALAELEKRSSGEFDGLFGSFPENKSLVLADITYYLRGYLLDKYDEPTLRKMQATYSDNPNWVPPSEGAEVALGVLHSIYSALGVDGERFHILLSGEDGLSGAKSREGGRKGGATQKRQRGTSLMEDEILDLARQDKERKRGWIACIAKKVGCTPQHAGHVIKQNEKQ